MMDKNTSHLRVEFISTLSTLLKKSDLTELRLENGFTSIHLKRAPNGDITKEKSVQAELKMPALEQDRNTEINNPSETILSPTVGVFHLFNGLLGFPRLVEAGELLATIHIGLLQRPVRALKKGVVDLANIKEGQIVEYGTELFQIQL